MEKQEIRINIAEIMNKVENASADELHQIYRAANEIFDYIDVPAVIMNDREIKTNLMIAAMFYIGEEIGRSSK